MVYGAEGLFHFLAILSPGGGFLFGESVILLLLLCHSDIAEDAGYLSSDDQLRSGENEARQVTAEFFLSSPPILSKAVPPQLRHVPLFDNVR